MGINTWGSSMPADPTSLLDPGTILKSAWPVLKPFLLVVAAIWTLRITLWYLKWRSLERAGMPQIDRMNGRDFEERIALLLARKGYKVEPTPYVGDWGADLVVSRDGLRSVVQLKRWKRPVSPKAVQEVVASKAKYGCAQAMIITNSHFTRAALELARVNSVEVWDRDRLARDLIQLQGVVAAPSAIPVAATQPVLTMSMETAPPRCTRCGREMVLRTGKYGKVWGCSGFPDCRHTLPVGA